MKVLAPGKLILSGEHAVVYGKPALAVAVNRYATASISHDLVPRVSFHFSDLEYKRRLSYTTLHNIKERLKRKYHQFIQGDFSIREVLHKPFELAQFAFGSIFEALNIKLNHGMNIHVQSDIPIGCGMGSSAATILSVIYAMTQHLDLKLSNEAIFDLALAAENMQHGSSSGLDLHVSLQGGCIYMHEKTISQRAVPNLGIYLVNTGTPKTSTGECVAKAAPLFKTSSIGDDFAAVTVAMDQGFAQNQQQAVSQAVQANHELLVQIGVVPERVQQFIAEIEKLGGVAKTCGAGAVAGDNAGIVMVMMPDSIINSIEKGGLGEILSTLCLRYGYTLLPILPEPRGTRVV